jgi:hypothetical protein
VKSKPLRKTGEATNDAAALAQTADAFAHGYPDSAWAKKASVWRK